MRLAVCQRSVVPVHGLRGTAWKRAVLVDNAALWASTLVLGIRGGWGRNGEPVSFDVLTALGLVLLVEALVFLAAVQTPRTPLGIVRRLTWLWAVGFAWVAVLWLSMTPAPPAFLEVWFAMGVALGWGLVGAFGILIELIGACVRRRSIAFGILVLVEAAIVRWAVRPLLQFYTAYPWGSALEAKQSPILPFGPTVAIGVDHAWPIAAAAGFIGLGGWLIHRVTVGRREMV